MINENYQVKEIYKYIVTQGYQGKYGLVRRVVAEMKKTGHFQYKVVLSRKYIIKLLYQQLKSSNEMNKEKLRKLYNLYPKVKILLELFYEFKSILNKMNSIKALETWIKKLKTLGFDKINRFMKGLNNDYEAVKNSILYPESNGVVEASVNKLKLVKRIMYGRCSFELLKLKTMRLNNY